MFITPETDLCEIKTGKKKHSIGFRIKGKGETRYSAFPKTGREEGWDPSVGVKQC